MEQGVMIVLTRATDGRREALWDWYSNQHLGDLLAVPGFRHGRLLQLGPLAPGGGEPAHHCLTLYDLEAEDLSVPLKEAGARMGGPQMPRSPALDSSATVVYLARTVVDLTAEESAAKRAVPKA
jgi:hypothetical protein